MHLHILGICGTFMGGIAILARSLGHRVSGSDLNVYPPMSTLLETRGIEVRSGYDPAHLSPDPDVVVIGNAMSRGNPAVEHTLNRGLPYVSGPEWLARHVLRGRWVLAVAGTHGKTSTSSLLAWILEDAGLTPGFLIGGVPENFGVSARPGDSPFFVVEADEYETAFFDKRSKFVHYRPRTLILNNLEYDHADIFPDVASIQRQFHHLVRTVPGNGLILRAAEDPLLEQVMQMGCWTPVEDFDADTALWRGVPLRADASRFEVWCGKSCEGTAEWDLIGRHNLHNGLAAIAAARHAGVPTGIAIEALSRFRNVKRRLELRGTVRGVSVYDDFAHHPTAIRATIAGLRARIGGQRMIAVLEPRSNTMRLGVHRQTLAPALAEADRVYLYAPPDLGWDTAAAMAELGEKVQILADFDELVDALVASARPGDHILAMSNGGFGGIHARLLERLGR
jgi:UDP-N-acetylmuramate: L-alanyl-gamma-D-glutamyl-meso-diaminopimelate ligase